MSRRALIGFVAGMLVAANLSVAAAGEFNDVLNIGDTAPAWSNLPGVDGKEHSLADLKGKDVVVVVFTCNSCPIATDYEDRIIAFAKKHCGPSAKAALVAINVNKVDEDKLPKMRERAEQKEYPFPYLYDETQKIARDFGAAFTPEFYVLDKERRVTYMGGMDNNSSPDAVTETYLEPALLAALKGEKPAKTETAAIGCRVRYARVRR